MAEEEGVINQHFVVASLPGMPITGGSPENQAAKPTTTDPKLHMLTSIRDQLTSRMNRLQELATEFPCLWDPQDLSYSDNKLKAKCREKLLVKYNNQSSIAITMDTLKKRLKALRGHLRWLKRRKGIILYGTSDNQVAIPTSTNASPLPRRRISQRAHQHRFEELVAEYPCLWDPQDVNYYKYELKAQCWEKLLVKYNNWSSIPITKFQLKKRVENFRKNRKRRKVNVHGTSDNQAAKPTGSNATPSPKLDIGERTHPIEQLAAEYPCLWNPQDMKHSDRYLKTQSFYKLLAKYNSLSSIPISVFQLLKQLEAMRREAQILEVGEQRGPSDEDSRGSWLLELGNSSVSTEPDNKIQRKKYPNLQTGSGTIVFHCCGVCGEVKSESLNCEDKPYIVNNKMAFSMNSLSIELDFDEDTTICQNCDAKLKDMYDFVKLVKNAQDKINSVNIVDERVEDVITIDDDDEMVDEDDNDENEDQKFIIDSLTVSDTELVKPTVIQTRKCEEFPNRKKTFRVTIDLNLHSDKTDNDSSTIDDIEAKYEIFKKCDGIFAKSRESADEVSKVIGTENSEDIILNGKTGIEHDTHKEFDEAEEIVAGDIGKQCLASQHTCDNENEESEDMIFDTKQEIVTDGIYRDIDETEENEDIIFDEKNHVTDDIHQEELDETGEIVADEDRRNNITSDSDKTHERAYMSDLASEEAVSNPLV